MGLQVEDALGGHEKPAGMPHKQAKVGAIQEGFLED